MEFSKDQIKEFKAKHGTIYLIEVAEFSCIIRKPNRKDISYITSVKDPIKMNETMLNQLWVAGDDVIKTNDDLFFAVSNKLGQVIEIKEAEIKKL